MTKEDILNLTNLKYFCDAVKLGSVSASSKVNYVTQSAISQGISKLERMLEVSLVAHHPKYFRITPAGTALFAQAQDLLQRAVDLKTQLLMEEDRKLGSLDFACTYSFALAIIPQHLKKFKTQYPEVNINFRAGKNDLVKQMLKQGTIDFAILPDEGDLDQFEKRKIYEGDLRLYATKQLSRKEQKKLGFILAEPGCKERILLNNSYFKKYGKDPTSVIEVSSWEIIANLVAEGMGIGYLPDYIVNGREDQLEEIDLGLDPHRYTICAISPVNMQLRKSSQIFLSYFL